MKFLSVDCISRIMFRVYMWKKEGKNIHTHTNVKSVACEREKHTNKKRRRIKNETNKWLREKSNEWKQQIQKIKPLLRPIKSRNNTFFFLISFFCLQITWNKNACIHRNEIHAHNNIGHSSSKQRQRQRQWQIEPAYTKQ